MEKYIRSKIPYGSLDWYISFEVYIYVFISAKFSIDFFTFSSSKGVKEWWKDKFMYAHFLQ